MSAPSSARPTARRHPRVAVVGGGLAGITAALRLADAGCRVTLHEAKPKLGGLTHSFPRDLGDERLWVDNGQHVFLRCCTSYRALLDRLGVTGQVTIQDRLDVTVLSGAYVGTGRLRRSGLPAPLHLGAALATYRWLSPLDRLKVVPAALALGRVDRKAPVTDDQSFGDWLARHGQSDRAVEAVWDLIGVATLNAPAARSSLALAATVFQLGLLDEPGAADIGWSDVPLQQLHGDAAAKALADAGVDVRLGAKVVSLDDLDAEAVVVATTAPEAARLAGDVIPDAHPADWADELGSAPIINLHLVYDRTVLDEPFVAAVDSPLQWVFDRTAHAGLRQGQYVAVSISAADQLVDLPVATLRERFVPHVEAVLPRARDAELRDFFVTRERHATFRPAPGSGRLRPATRTTSARVYLAGAWTATGWPATMEGAVRSGEAAADALLETRSPLEVGA
ncbi:hydroxysqualene dehydroxylase HpnE [Nocardioides sp. DS6]|uniref:Hydroxysqualene dehydroxylase HpnE n=1 Tax=Nocardioides eburneus TaxID=3231482 RepID=A0ABV3SWN0_9ACTN